MATGEYSARDLLAMARAAVARKDHRVALDNFQQFFEHALDEDPYSLYGVRLSYCLAEWAQLGRDYPPAHVCLRKRGEVAIQRLGSTRNPEHFHDFVCICAHLDSKGEAIEQFLRYHVSDPALAKATVRFIWSELIAAGELQVAAAYLGDPDDRYSMAVTRFDETARIGLENPELGGAVFERQVQTAYVCDVKELLLVLRAAGRDNDIARIKEIARRDAESRGCTQMFESLFGGDDL